MMKRNRFLFIRALALLMGGTIGILTSVPVEFVEVQVEPSGGEGFQVNGQPLRPAIPVQPQVWSRNDVKTKEIIFEDKKAKKPPPPPGQNKPKAKPPKDGVVNPHPFRNIVEPRGICNDKGPLVVAYVHSAPAKVVRRAMVRKTWANITHHPDKANSLRVFFAMGAPSKSKDTILSEIDKYGDILQEDYFDDYKNLSYKAVGSLRWITDNCKATKFVLKTDDDAFVNVFSLLHHLAELDEAGLAKDLFLCRLLGHMPVLRQGKWGIPREDYPETHYPPYCSGLAFVLSMDVAVALHAASYRTPFFWVDDAWLTGMVAKEAGVAQIQTSSLYDLNKDSIEKKFLGPKWHQYWFGHLGPKAYQGFWDRLVALAAANPIPASNDLMPGRLTNDVDTNKQNGSLT